MIEIIKVPITQAQFAEKIQTFCPGKFSVAGLKIIFDYLESQAIFRESEVHLPDLCKDFGFQESTSSQCSSAVRQLLTADPDVEKGAVLKALRQDLGVNLIGVTSNGTVVWWNG
jgi:hypothetical protein